ncbi:MAG TPA: undecaprenyl-diphosphate phosphatase [Ilumatobacteraceae bacterium]|nr:undecaprenyl-diphosphate phosphatase [Ilumatobacteraceae bacterium]
MTAADQQHIDSSNDRFVVGGVIAGALTAVIAIVVLSLGSEGPLTPLKAIILGAVEGFTEYLPVSSTGHLLVTQRLLGLDDEAERAAADSYVIAIQIGAILAVVVLYWRRLGQITRGLAGRDVEGRSLLVALVVAFVPAAFVGLVLGDTIKDQLFGAWPVVVAWFVGGVFLVVWRPRPGSVELTQFTVRHAAIIGVAQILALWPGTSRSLVTIVAALAIGASMAAAVEFSFLLGLATLSAATFYDLAQNGQEILDVYGWRTPLAGGIVAFVTAAIAVRWLVAFLRTRPLAVFGWYRIGIAIATAAMIGLGVI